jgi:hypothetical protein
MAVYSPKDRTRLAQTRAEKQIDTYRRPPKDMPWIWVTEELIFSPAFTSLSANASRAIWRIIGEYLKVGRKDNGQLIVTHPDFIAYGVTGRLVADAIDELVYKGLIRVKRGKAADGTAHPSLYRLTFFGDHEASSPTNDWKAIGKEEVAQWDKVRAAKAFERSTKAGRKKKTSIHESEIAHLTKVKLPAVRERKAL